MADLRIYCTEDYKKQVKTAAVRHGVSVSDFLMEIIQQHLPIEDVRANLQAELEQINSLLATHGGRMTAEERQTLKDRRAAIKQIIERGEMNCED